MGIGLPATRPHTPRRRPGAPHVKVAAGKVAVVLCEKGLLEERVVLAPHAHALLPVDGQVVLAVVLLQTLRLQPAEHVELAAELDAQAGGVGGEALVEDPLAHRGARRLQGGGRGGQEGNAAL